MHLISIWQNLLRKFLILVPQKGEAYIYNCPYSSLCRQVVIDEEGRVKNFKLKDMANPTVELVVRKYP